MSRSTRTCTPLVLFPSTWLSLVLLLRGLRRHLGLLVPVYKCHGYGINTPLPFPILPFPILPFPCLALVFGVVASKESLPNSFHFAFRFRCCTLSFPFRLPCLCNTSCVPLFVSLSFSFTFRSLFVHFLGLGLGQEGT